MGAREDALRAGFIDADAVDALRRAKDDAYQQRNRLVALLAGLYPSAIGLDPEESDPDWRQVVFIDLPTGQVSFHVHRDELATQFKHVEFSRTVKWDGHSDQEKWARIAKMLDMEPEVEVERTDDQQVHLRAKHWALAAMADNFVQSFHGHGAINYLEQEMMHPTFGDFLVTMQRKEGKTPHELRQEAEKQADMWKQQVQALEADVADKDDEIEALSKEVARLKECFEHHVFAAEAKTVRCSMDITPEGKPCIIVTHPRGDEKAMAEDIASLMNLWHTIADSLAADKRVKKLEGALRELVDLKDHKDAVGKNDDYLERQPKAWAEARKLLEEGKPHA